MIINIRRIVITLVAAMTVWVGFAQKAGGFDPARFEAELEQFVATEAALTPAESAVFFPVYREMRNKQLAYFAEERRLRFVDTSDEVACADVIKRRDANDIELKNLQRDYHARFLKILPATKVFRILRAEDAFHRRLFKKGLGHDTNKSRKDKKTRK